MTEYNDILLTGATGFIGRSILEALKDVRVDTLSRSESATFRCDLTREVPVLSRRYDAVVHVAGTDEPALADALNNGGTERLLQALEALPPRHFTLISSVHVYGCDPGEDVKEDCFLRPDTPYARSKIRAEKRVEQWCATHGVTLAILRPAITVGPGMHGQLAKMADAVARGVYFHIRGNKARRSLVMVDDVARAVCLTLGVSGVFNVTDGREHTVVEIANAIAANIKENKWVLSMPKGLIVWPLRLFGWLPGMRRVRERYRVLTTTATFSSSALTESTGFEPYDCVEVMSRRHKGYPYRESVDDVEEIG